MNQHIQLVQLQDYFSQLTDTVFGGTHDFRLSEIETSHGISPKSLVLNHYREQFEEDDDSIYSLTSEYGIDMLETPNWEDALYQICQELHLEKSYEEFLAQIEDFVGGDLTNAWHISPKKFTYNEDYFDFEGNGMSSELNSCWQDLLLNVNGTYYLLHFGVLE